MRTCYGKRSYETWVLLDSEGEIPHRYLTRQPWGGRNEVNTLFCLWAFYFDFME